MSIYNSDAHCWSGLLSGENRAWQEGLRIVCREIGDVQFHASQSGYLGWDAVADAAIQRGAPSLLLIGHSNGGYAITSAAARVKSAGIPCWVLCFDRTMKECPPLGSNVPEALDLWAGLKNLKRGPDFTGNLKRRDYSHLSHIGVIGDPDAQRDAIEFGKRWRASR